MPDGLMLDFVAPCGRFRLTFEDDGRVAYAYLKEVAGPIIGDVWVYNRCPTPAEAEWPDRSLIPFANSAAFLDQGAQLTAHLRPEDALVSWEYEDTGPIAYIYLLEVLYGVLGVGDKPGHARHARRDNRIARVLRIEDDPSVESGTERS